MLKTIRLKNFKLHEDSEIEAAPITVFIGPNNSGKSSIFQALLLLRQAAARNDKFLCQPPAGIQPAPDDHYLYSPSVTVDVGSFGDIVRVGANSVDFGMAGSTVPPDTVHSVAEAAVDCFLQVKNNQLVYSVGSISCMGNDTKWEFIDGKKTIEISPGLKVEEAIYMIRGVETFKMTRPDGFKPIGVTPAQQVSREVQQTYGEFSQWIGSAPLSLLTSIHPVYALRGFEVWGYPITRNVSARLDLLTLHDRELALPNALASNRRLKQRLSERLLDLLGISIDFEIIDATTVRTWAKHTGNGRQETLFANEGSGANQIPFLLVPVLLASRGETILLSEPEAHLHPKAQCELTRMLLTVAKKENIQFFIETHSEHVLHVILNAVAKGEWTPDQVSLQYFQNRNGAAEVSRREINKFGQVNGGLPDFFEQSLAELTDYLNALSKS